MRRRLAGTLLIILFFAGFAEGQVLDKALQLRMGTPTREPLRVIATFDHIPNALDRAVIGSVASRTRFLRARPMVLLEANTLGIQRLLGLPGLKSLYLDKQLQYFLHESVALIGAARAAQELGADGRGIGIAILDSGVDATHLDLQFGTKVVQNVKIAGLSASDSPTGTGLVQTIEGLPNSDTSSGHGTHCAGTAAGSGAASGGWYRGVATKLTWSLFVNDLDLFLLRDGVEAAASQDTQALSQTAREGVAIDYPQAGTWTAEARGWLTLPQDYTLTIQQYLPIGR
jgi:hypothetical protein